MTRALLANFLNFPLSITATLEIISVADGGTAIRGEASNRYIGMADDGKLATRVSIKCSRNSICFGRPPLLSTPNFHPVKALKSSYINP